MNTIAERLTWALEKSDIRSIRSLHRELEDRGLPVGTYSTVHRYFSGEVEEPPLSFLEAAEQVLEVPAAWLAFGAGATDDLGRALGGMNEAIRKMGTRMREIVRKGLGAQEVPPDAFDAVDTLTLDYIVAVGRGREAMNGTQHREVAEAIAAPIRSLGHDPASLSPSRYGYYVITVAEALRYLLADDPDHVITKPAEEDEDAQD